MKNKIIKRIIESFQLSDDLLSIIQEKSLTDKIPKLKSNKIGEQFWCIIGARESYLKALKNNGNWQGFSCSLDNNFCKDSTSQKLKSSSTVFEKIVSEIDSLNDKQEEILLNLFTHEIQHHGQLIRYFYALEINFPKSWNKKYTV